MDQISSEVAEKIQQLVNSDAVTKYSGWHIGIERAEENFKKLKPVLSELLSATRRQDPDSPVYKLMEHIWLQNSYGSLGQGAVSESSFYEHYDLFLDITKKFIVGLKNKTPLSQLMMETPLELDGRGNLKAIRIRTLSVLSNLTIPSFFYDVPFYKLCSFLGVSRNFPDGASDLMIQLRDYLPPQLRTKSNIVYTFPWIVYEELVKYRPIEKQPNGRAEKFWILNYPLPYLEFDGTEYGARFFAEEGENSRGRALISKFQPRDCIVYYHTETNQFMHIDRVDEILNDCTEIRFEAYNDESMNISVGTVAEDEAFQNVPLKELLTTQPLIEITLSQFDALVKLSTVTLFEAAAKLHSDDSLVKDYFQYELYAEAIASIVKETKLSPPPLNIAIIAPWGHGKTTLMRFIQKRFEEPNDIISNRKETKTSLGVLWYWLVNINGWFNKTWRKYLKKLLNTHGKSNGEEPLEVSNPENWSPHSVKNPTVWFNPWHYQSSEQIWAGLGHAMISQLVSKLPVAEQELFWLKLRLKRTDKNAIRRDIHRRMLENVLPWLICLLLLIIGTILLWSFLGAIWSLVGLSIIPVLVQAFNSFKECISNSLVGKFSEYVKEPRYENRLGLYHEINEDLSHVCSELIDPNFPAIVFIDDLDRCSPKVVAEVIEAINLMMTSNFRDRCYFIFGMDAQMVSASLDVRYAELVGKYANKEKTHGSVGWYFLDKFIQLPFFIPVIKDSDKEKFLTHFFKSQENTFAPSSSESHSIEKLKADARKAIEHPEEYEEISNKYLSNKLQLQEEMTRVLMSKSKDSFDIADRVMKFSRYLDASPRGLKRFANLLRFYHTQQHMRRYSGLGDDRNKYASTLGLAKWLVINLRWPQMVRWIQWEYEDKLIVSCDPFEKAKAIDDQIMQASKDIFDGDVDKAFEIWKKNLYGKAEHLKWLLDKDLFKLLFDYRDDPDCKLSMALEHSVW